MTREEIITPELQPEELIELEDKLQISFTNKALLLKALVHRSVSYEISDIKTNERLEFLGDAVLNLIIAEHLFRKYPELAEGDMAKIRASLVNTEVLAGFGKKLDLGKYLHMAPGARKSGTAERDSVLECTYEAILGAIYLDQGLSAAEDHVLRMFKRLIALRAKSPGINDFKSVLQELTMITHIVTPRYELISEEGPVHDKIFRVKVFIKDELFGTGSGKSKKKAEQKAAELALRKLKKAQALL